MKSILILILGLALSTCAFSTNLTFTVSDPFPGSTCTTLTPGCDVLGDRATYDIQKGTFSNFGANGLSGQFDIYTNYANSTLASFTSGVNMYVGDLLFTVNGVVKYGVALTSHAESGNAGARTGGNSVVAGELYQVLNVANGVETSTQAMGNYDPTLYRTGQNVWLRNVSGALSPLALGNVSITTQGSGAELDIRVTFNNNLPVGFVSDFTGANFGVSFASATCANDIMTGYSTPEPMTLGMMGAGLIGLGLLRRFKKA